MAAGFQGQLGLCPKNICPSSDVMSAVRWSRANGSVLPLTLSPQPPSGLLWNVWPLDPPGASSPARPWETLKTERLLRAPGSWRFSASEAERTVQEPAFLGRGELSQAGWASWRRRASEAV